ncbi:DnaD domain protein [Enterococcus asini]|uniref:DnaD domain protein n=1 Tax=Enterococcus asini TaxID=57732 RepID=UPI00266B4A13|nr:DnaD domain protein [Enterococcus asini]
MENKELKPKDVYRPIKARPLTSGGEQALYYLYQPITGSDAIAVYFTLLGDGEDPKQADYLHIDALNALDMGLPRFIAARKRLEGIGLLKVYVKDDPDLGQSYLYELLEPAAPSEFFQEETLALLLLHKVSEFKFKQLAQRFAPKAVERQGYQEVTSRFAQVYGQLDVTSEVALVEAETGAYQEVTDEATLKVDLSALDWQFMQDFGEKKYIDPALYTKELREKLTFYHEFFGYTELELVELVAQAVSLETGELSYKELEKLAQAKSQLPKEKKAETTIEAPEQALRRKNAFLAQGYTEEDWQAVEAAEAYPPMKYLQALKKAKRSFVTKNEEWLLKDLVEKSPLPNPVINQLLNYVLVDQNKSDLNARLVNTIATDWSEKQLKTAIDAIQYVRQRKIEQKEQQTQKQTKQKQGTNRYNRPQKQETLEDWTKYTVKPADPALEAELDRQLKEFYQEEGDK